MVETSILELARPSHPLYMLYGDRPFIQAILKKESGDAYAAPSQQVVSVGRKEQPFNFKVVSEMQLHNVYHASCIHSKVSSTVGLGFLNDKVLDTLDPLCDTSFQDVLNDAIEDYYQCGNGYIEVVREGDAIKGFHHIPARLLAVVIEDLLRNRHYEVLGSEGEGEVRMACFGDLAAFNSRLPHLPALVGANQVAVGKGYRSEVIHFRRSTSLSPWYGFPDWLSAVAAIELSQCLHQHFYDFFVNRGVPEFMLWLMGENMPEDDWKKIQKALIANTGVGNSRKSIAVHLKGLPENFKVQLDKLAMESKSDTSLFSAVNQELGLEVVSAHRMPPLLAGIQTPGKLGATNELPNALMAFQLLVVGPAQHAISTLLGCTLGNPALNGGLGLGKKDFQLKKITDEMNLAMMDTIARMREPLASGRDPSQGLRNDGGDSTPQAMGQLGAGVGASSIETRGVAAGKNLIIAKEEPEAPEHVLAKIRKMIDDAAQGSKERRERLNASMLRYFQEHGREPSVTVENGRAVLHS